MPPISIGIPPIPLIIPPIYENVLSKSLFNILIPVLLTWNTMWTLILVNVFAIILVSLSRLQRFDFYLVLIFTGISCSALHSLPIFFRTYGAVAKINFLLGFF